MGGVIRRCWPVAVAAADVVIEWAHAAPASEDGTPSDGIIVEVRLTPLLGLLAMELCEMNDAELFDLGVRACRPHPASESMLEVASGLAEAVASLQVLAAKAANERKVWDSVFDSAVELTDRVEALAQHFPQADRHQLEKFAVQTRLDPLARAIDDLSEQLRDPAARRGTVYKRRKAQDGHERQDESAVLISMAEEDGAPEWAQADTVEQGGTKKKRRPRKPPTRLRGVKSDAGATIKKETSTIVTPARKATRKKAGVKSAPARDRQDTALAATQDESVQRARLMGKIKVAMSDGTLTGAQKARLMNELRELHKQQQKPGALAKFVAELGQSA
eukprot:5381986-Prymnesium_polylepis.2